MKRTRAGIDQPSTSRTWNLTGTVATFSGEWRIWNDNEQRLYGVAHVPWDTPGAREQAAPNGSDCYVSGLRTVGAIEEATGFALPGALSSVVVTKLRDQMPPSYVDWPWDGSHRWVPAPWHLVRPDCLPYGVVVAIQRADRTWTDGVNRIDIIREPDRLDGLGDWRFRYSHQGRVMLSRHDPLLHRERHPLSDESMARLGLRIAELRERWLQRTASAGARHVGIDWFSWAAQEPLRQQLAEAVTGGMKLGVGRAGCVEDDVLMLASGAGYHRARLVAAVEAAGGPASGAVLDRADVKADEMASVLADSGVSAMTIAAVLRAEHRDASEVAAVLPSLGLCTVVATLVLSDGWELSAAAAGRMLGATDAHLQVDGAPARPYGEPARGLPTSRQPVDDSTRARGRSR